MTAGTAQFDADRTLSFFNQPFAAMAQLDPEWLAEQPEFDRVIERMRDEQRLPETRDFPAWKEERRGWFTSPEEVIEEEWMLPNGDHIRVVAQPLPDGGLRLFLEDRTEQLRLASARDTLLRVRAATFDNLFEAISVFASDGRLYLWNRALPRGLGARRGMARDAIRASTSWSRRWRASSSTRPPPRKSARWSARRPTNASRRAGASR